ncbi:MAG: FeoC-like transcriptional regulator [Marivibrio sp.]|uniref:FeoC-like transcriptional regulator n=1 Tax=Marivibrio sp. TaxID=2039719 RepID=UPI0032EF8F96
MILSELRDYLRTHRRATLDDMAARFDKHPDALRGMLRKWVAKGKVAKVSDAGACRRACGGCSVGGPEIYEWSE